MNWPSQWLVWHSIKTAVTARHVQHGTKNEMSAPSPPFYTVSKLVTKWTTAHTHSCENLPNSQRQFCLAGDRQLAVGHTICVRSSNKTKRWNIAFDSLTEHMCKCAYYFQDFWKLLRLCSSPSLPSFLYLHFPSFPLVPSLPQLWLGSPGDA